MDPLSSEPKSGASAGDGALTALLAVARLLGAAAEGDAQDVYDALVREARACFGARRVVLLAQEPSRRLRVLGDDAAPDVAGRTVDLDGQPAVAELVDRRVRLQRVNGSRLRDLTSLVAGDEEPQTALLLLLRAADGCDGALLLTGVEGRTVSAVDVDVATAFADAAAAALSRISAVSEHERVTDQQEALTRAAKTLNESLDLETVLARICHEAATILDADIVTVYRGGQGQDLTVAAVAGLPPEVVGYVLERGRGLSGKVAVHGRAMLTNDYQRIAELPADSPFSRARSAMAAPMVWDGERQGVLAVGYFESRRVGQDELSVLETFAELAATACANASAHAGLARAARTDGLTGCLNHASMHEGLINEIERAVRSDASLSLVLVDLDDFKQVNEKHGHLVGDEVLRRAGHALRHSTRPYDLAARYGGDEFAIVAVGAGEAEADEIAHRALERVTNAIHDLLPEGASAGTAGVAEWTAGTSPTELIARADRALLFGKHEGMRGGTIPFSTVPDNFRPGRFSRQDRGLPEPPPMPPGRTPADWPDDRVDARLRKRTRQLSLANALGAQLSAMTDPAEILECSVDDLHRAFGYFCVAMMRLRGDDFVEAVAMRGELFSQLPERRWSQRREEGLIGRCLLERRPVISNDVKAEPDYVSSPETRDVRGELCVPVWVGDTLWGVIDVQEPRVNAFDEDDLLLLQTVAAQVGSAMRSALLYERLERAYLGTAEALATALEAKDAYTADHARSIVEQAEAIGRRLGLDDDELRDLRFAAVFHDIGKIAVPEGILHKTGPLSAEERVVMERHTIVGEQILAPVEFLSGVRRLVRHEHERWDGRGYPDRLAGEDIPLGSRIILACDALHAMTSNRPYREGMTLPQALQELRRNAGTQFDPLVVDTLFEVIFEDVNAPKDDAQLFERRPASDA